eukprot:MONOS_9253.1-p1 / transcript=MONOS_9253.1 / gene=MONOS_9253 / organism=Monocercomonoides_exilis_PA203 / gene_product=poly(U)-binding-splicing factor PUF60 / transcript_product=poly(U)-binding-splicing factor PUF60 / location=Mono_scaffold00375:1289-2172(-) / protein_length=204 / sequence_SO=supercontig / SO=protein_coding / is_pseudo=false
MVLSFPPKIYVGSLHFEITEPIIRSLFSPFGPIRTVQLQMEPGTTRSKGFCFIDFFFPESAQVAMQEMNGFFFCGRNIKVNRPSVVMPGPAPVSGSVPQMSGIASPTQQLTPVKPMLNRIYVGSVPFDMGEDIIRPLFEPFGTVVSCQMMQNPETGLHKGFGFIEFTNEESAKNAILGLNGFQFGGRALKVNYPTLSGMSQPQ